jgi:hypothetical protein
MTNMMQKPLLDTIEPEVLAELMDRREAIKRGAKVSSGVAAALAIGSLPIGLAALSGEVYGQGTAPSIRSVLEFAFLLENLEAEFYKAVLGSATGTGAAAANAAFATVRAAFTATETATVTKIRDNEIAHVNFLRTAITANGGAPSKEFTPADFDFTGGNGSGTGPFAAATTDKAFLLAVTQGFEDTGVRAYKGQAAFLMSNDAILTAALGIHSVEARHASKIRRMRRAAGAPEVVRYSGTIRGGGAAAAGATGTPSAAVVAAFEAIYGGAVPESNTTHTVHNGTAAANITAAQIAGLNDVGGTNALQEAFDEPLTREEVTAIVAPFVVGDAP